MKKLLTPNPRSYGRPENSTPQSDAEHARVAAIVDEFGHGV